MVGLARILPYMKHSKHTYVVLVHLEGGVQLSGPLIGPAKYITLIEYHTHASASKLPFSAPLSTRSPPLRSPPMSVLGLDWDVNR